jgi:uncharacterized protein
MVVLGFISCSNSSEEMELMINGNRITVEIARTAEQRRTGLMHRKHLDPDRGMLFVSERDEKLSFWMKDTVIPLSLAFIAKDGTITKIHHMRPLSHKSIVSERSVRFALEVNQGYFDEHGIEAGDTVEFPEQFLRTVR